MAKIQLIGWGLLYSLMLLLAACQDKEDTPAAHPERWQVLVMFPADGLGDLSYNDNTLRGIEQAALEKKISMRYFIPSPTNDVEEFFRLMMTIRLDENEHLLLVLAGNEYTEFARELMKDVSGYPDMNRKKVLLFESEALDVPVHTFMLPFSGASYLLGYCAAHYSQEALVLAGNATDNSVQQATLGFTDGFRAAGGGKVDSQTLSDGPEGYSMPVEAYTYVHQWATKYPGRGFIYPVAGGSNQGVYRYARENRTKLYTAGVDVDQSALSSDIIASVVKHTDKVIYNFITDWVERKELPLHTDYGLESGMIELVPAPIFQAEVIKFKDQAWQAAIDFQNAFRKNL